MLIPTNKKEKFCFLHQALECWGKRCAFGTKLQNARENILLLVSGYRMHQAVECKGKHTAFGIQL